MKIPLWHSLSLPVRYILTGGFVAAGLMVTFFLGKDGQLLEFLKYLLEYFK